MRFGTGDFVYELVDDWGRLPEDWAFSQVAGVAVDSQDRVYAYHRGMRPVIVFSREGKVLSSWGDGLLAEAHGLYIDRHDNLFMVDRGAHTIEKCTPEGKVLLTLGEKYQSAPKHSNLPFNKPQGVATAPNGDIYVADGRRYNFSVHRYSADGQHLKSWGKQGAGPGEFAEPHSIWVLPDGTVMVGDRGNDRIQYFTPDGEFMREWTGLAHPDHFYVSPRWHRVCGGDTHTQREHLFAGRQKTERLGRPGQQRARAVLCTPWRVGRQSWRFVRE
jgi:streptogramin lyase